MKHSLLALTLALVSSVSSADPVSKHQKNCETPEVKAMMGTTGSCRIVLATKKIEKQGTCVGTFKDSIPCVVTFIAFKQGAALNLTCETDMNTPLANQDMGAEASGYKVATLIRQADGQDVVQNDENDYSLFSNSMVEVTIMDTILDEVPFTTGTVILGLPSGQVPLTNVVCK